MTVRAVAPSLLGRVAELELLDAVLDEAVVAGPRVVLCSGEAGAGKTALLRLFADRAADGGATVWWPRGLGRPGAPPFWMWQQVVAPHLFIDSPSMPADRAAIAERLAERLRPSSSDSPAVLVLDDLDRADGSSLATLPRVVRALGRSPVLLCCAYQSDARHSREWIATRDTLEAAAAAQLPLSGLAAEDVRRLLVASGLRAPGHDLLAQVLAVTGGNPLFVVELAWHLTRGRSDRSERPLPATLRDLVRHRLDALPPSVRSVLDAASIIGERFRVGDVARALALDPAACLDAVDAAARAGIVVALSTAESEFRHPLFREFVESGLRAAERTDLHRRVAQALEEAAGRPSGADLGVLAHHWAVAAAGGASAEATSWARRAADEAMRTHAYEEAERLYLVALDHAIGRSELDRASLLLASGAAALRGGHLAAARDACTSAVDSARGHRSHDLLARAALTLEPMGDPAWDGDIYSWCTAALADDRHDQTTQVRLLARLSQAASYLRLDEEADRTSADALRRAAHLNDPEARVDALIARQLVRSGPDDVEELGELADQMLAVGATTGRADLQMWGRLWRIDTYWYAGRLAAIAGETAGLQRCAEQAGGPYARWHLLSTRGQLALARAEFDEAERVFGEAVELMARIDHPAVHGASVAFGFLLGHHRGHPSELMDGSGWDFSTDVRWDLFSRLARAFVLVDNGELDEAAALYTRCGDPGEWAMPPAGGLVGLAIAARVATGIGALDDVANLRERLARYRGRFVAAAGGGSNFLGPVDLALGRCSASLGAADAARVELETAGRMCRAVGAPGFGVEADTELAAVHARGGDHASAALVARRALPMARILGMTPWADRLAPFAGADAEVGGLTAREREIASLVAAGLSNRAVADRLVISERTAQNHVQHILGKLGFANRAQIAVWASRRPNE